MSIAAFAIVHASPWMLLHNPLKEIFEFFRAKSKS